MKQRRRRQLDLGFAAQASVRGAGTASPRERRATDRLDLGYAHLRQLYQLGQIQLTGRRRGPDVGERNENLPALPQRGRS